MMNKIFFFATYLILLFCSSCDSDIGQPTFDSDYGAVLATVTENSDLLPDIMIHTIPETTIYQTDNSGSVIIKNLDPGNYKIVASIPDYGEGFADVTIEKGRVSSAQIEINYNFFLLPDVTIILPEAQAIFDVGQLVEFTINVDAPNYEYEDIDITWSSDIDGLLSTEGLQSDNSSAIYINDLSEGDHILQVEATTPDGFKGIAYQQITIKELPNGVTLNPIGGTDEGVLLNWTASEEVDFSHYNIYKSTNFGVNYQVIETITDRNTLNYLDTDVIETNNYYYHIGEVLTNSLETISNTHLTYFYGSSFFIDSNIDKMIVDPDRPFIYAIDEFSDVLLFINTENKTVTKTIDLPPTPTDLAISIDGSKLYITNFHPSSEINVINLETQEFMFNFSIDPNVGTWYGKPYRLVTLSDNRIAYTGEDQWSSVVIVNGFTGTVLDESITAFEPFLFTNQTGNELFVAESSISNGSVKKYNIIDNMPLQIGESDSGSTFDEPAIISPDQQYLFFRRMKLLASDLQVSLGTFPQKIYASNRDGSIVLGRHRYYNGETFGLMGLLPFNTTIIAADPEEDIFYMFNANTNRIHIFTLE